jgi:hypothetical protein
VVDELDRAISLFADGELVGAAHALAYTRGAALTRSDTDRLAEIDAIVSQMQSYLDGADRAAFDRTLTFNRRRMTSPPEWGFSTEARIG